MKKLVIFDLDGTLLNTIADLAQSTNHALSVLGYPTHEESAYNFMVGNGINKLFERALPEGEKSEENVLRVRKEFIPYYDAHNADTDRKDVLYVGDSGVDMQTAINAGVTSCGVTWGFRPRTELEEFHPDYIADKAEEILKRIN